MLSLHTWLDNPWEKDTVHLEITKYDHLEQIPSAILKHLITYCGHSSNIFFWDQQTGQTRYRKSTKTKRKGNRF